MPSRGPSPLRPAFSSALGAASFRVEAPMSPVADELHPVFHAGRVAVITGAGNGIGRAAAKELARLQMRLALADVVEDKLAEVGKEVEAIAGEGNVLVIPTDVSKIEDVVKLKEKVYETWGEVGVLMNNAAIGPRGTSWDGLDNWRKTFDVNVFGVLNVQHTFVPSMIHQENQSVIINTGSKQGITNPPGNASYNASKAAVKSLTEGLAWELRERPAANLTAHLFVPGWTYTALGGAAPGKDKPAGAWTPEETVLYMLDKVRNGDFYILCPDNETRPEVDHLRVMWGAGDITEGRPALSRWHPNYKSLFEEYVREGLEAMRD